MHSERDFRAYFICSVPYSVVWKSEKERLVLHDLRITTGYEDGTFRPNQPITRMEAASLVYRTLAFLGKLPPRE
uniref:S-layer homology domain-containing protein n=1 Tax=Fervidicoccus fontis TaxID=683846 RepID=A0A7J3SMX5_9CREN